MGAGTRMPAARYTTGSGKTTRCMAAAGTRMPMARSTKGSGSMVFDNHSHKHMWLMFRTFIESLLFHRCAPQVCTAFVEASWNHLYSILLSSTAVHHQRAQCFKSFLRGFRGQLK